MTQVTEAIYSNGVLKPLTELGLANDEHVRLIVESLAPAALAERTAAMERFFSRVQSMHFNSGGRLPARDELHERV